LQAKTVAVLRQVDGPASRLTAQTRSIGQDRCDGDAQQIEIALSDMRADGGEIKLSDCMSGEE